MKPNDDYGGKGIVLGWTVDQAAWDKAVRTAVETPYVVQRRVRLPFEAFPSFEDGKLVVLDRMLDTNPYVAFGKIHARLPNPDFVRGTRERHRRRRIDRADVPDRTALKKESGIRGQESRDMRCFASF